LLGILEGESVLEPLDCPSRLTLSSSRKLLLSALPEIADGNGSLEGHEPVTELRGSEAEVLVVVGWQSVPKLLDDKLRATGRGWFICRGTLGSVGRSASASANSDMVDCDDSSESTLDMLSDGKRKKSIELLEEPWGERQDSDWTVRNRADMGDDSSRTLSSTPLGRSFTTVELNGSLEERRCFRLKFSG
jgi:hypothetical protein